MTRDVLTAVLHAILFHRLFGVVKPKTFEVLDVTMVWSHLLQLFLCCRLTLRSSRV